MKFLILLFIFTSCSFNRKSESDYYLLLGDKHKCTKEYFEEDESIIEGVQRVSTEGAGHLLSYTLVGTAYTGEVLVRFVGGIAVGVVICSPVIAVEGALGGGGDASGRCIGEVGGNIMSTEKLKWGSSVHNDTKELRCPEVDHIAKGIRRVSKCYLENNKPKKAYDQLMTLLSDREILRCISSDEKKKLSPLLKRAKTSS